jgi:hypothetical protein
MRKVAGETRIGWKPGRRFLDGLIVALLMVVSIAMQYRSRAYTSDLTLDNDEPAHAVSSLMVRDYLTQDFPHNPVRFASEFYAHYPKVAIGHWPPLFYAVEAAWMLVLGRTRIAMLLFVALCGGALLASVYLQVRQHASVIAALLPVGMLVASGAMQQMVSAVRPDLLLALLVFWAGVFCSRFVFFGDRKALRWFLGLGIAAMLVHGRGAMLLFVPFFLIVLARRAINWKWAVAIGFVLLLLPLPRLLGQADALSLHSILLIGRLFIARMRFTLGLFPLLLALVGSVGALRPGDRQPFWAAMLSLAISAWVFHVLVPIHWDDRLMVTALPAVAALAGNGVQVLRSRFSIASRLWERGWDAAVAMCVLLAAAWGLGHAERKPDLNYHQLIANGMLCGNQVTLIAADGLNEGALIAEQSLADPARSHTILRGSKVLAHSTWAGHRYQMVYASDDALAAYLDRSDVSLVLVQRGEGVAPHVIQLRRMLTDAPQWAIVPQSPVTPVEIFRKRAFLQAPAPQPQRLSP